MRLRLFFVFALISTVIGISASACTTILGDFDVTNDVGGEGGLTSNKPLGADCSAGTECASTFCADGVCCESACSGTCESCAALEKGKCLPVPDGQDPKNQCVAPPREAGTDPDPVVPPDDAGAAVEDAAVGVDAAASTGDDAGLVFGTPDGGLVPEENKCKGTCDGAKKCKFPGKEMSCGTQYCSSPTENTGLRCSGNGYCDLTTSACAGYACNVSGDGVCKNQCKTDDDCDAQHFCDGNVCKDKLPNGQQCSLPNQCKSGFCIIDAAGGVCCNSECDKIPGGNCKQAGNVGQCKCNLNCGQASCRLFYRDGDNDKHGDENANPAITGSTSVGCEGQVPPAGFSDVKDDCNDQDIDVFPGQLNYFSRETNIKGGFDFNCDKKETKQSDEYPTSTGCRYCAPPTSTLKCGPTSTVCYRNGQPATLTCELTRNLLGGTYTCDGSSTGPIRGGGLDKGFIAPVPCGKTGVYYDCGACTTKSTVGTRDGTQTAGYYQKCR